MRPSDVPKDALLCPACGLPFRLHQPGHPTPDYLAARERAMPRAMPPALPHAPTTRNARTDGRTD